MAEEEIDEEEIAWRDAMKRQVHNIIVSVTEWKNVDRKSLLTGKALI